MATKKTNQAGNAGVAGDTGVAENTSNVENAAVAAPEPEQPDKDVDVVDALLREAAPQSDETEKEQEKSDDEGKTVEGAETKRPQTPLLESIAVLSDRHRVPSWQLAALLRLMGWESDRMATDEEFQEGLRLLQNRRIGGGRM